MRSIQSLNRNFGIQNALTSVTSIVLDGFDSAAARATGAHPGSMSRSWSSMRDALKRLLPTATCVKPRVTGGACGAHALQSSGRHIATCRLAAS